MRELAFPVINTGERTEEQLLLGQIFGAQALLRGEMRAALTRFCEAHHETVLLYLPAVLEPLARTSGWNLVLDLVARLGGRRIYLPTDANRFARQTTIQVAPDHYQLWRLQADGSGQIDVPSAWGVYLSVRRAALSYAVSDSWAPAILQSTFGLSRTQLRTYRSSVFYPSPRTSFTQPKETT